MLEFSKIFLFYSLRIISTISFVNISVLYWIPIQIPLSSYSAVSLMMISLFLKNYYLIPISFGICLFMFVASLSFLRERLVIPIILFVFLLFDFFLLAISFFDAWFNDANFIVIQAIQVIISSLVVIFTCVYCCLLRKTNQGDQSNRDNQGTVL